MLMTGTIIAQGIPLLLQPYLRRVYSPEDFGAIAVYLNIFSVITIVSSLRYEATIVLPKNNNEAANILSLTVIITVIFNFLLLLLILLFKNNLVHLLNFPKQYSNYLYFLPFSGCVFGIYQGINNWLIRQKAFKASTANKIVRRGIEGLIQSIAGILKFPGGLFIGDLAGNFANGIAGIRQTFKNNFDLKYISKRKIGYVLKKYIDFPKYNVFPGLLSITASILPFLIINKIYSSEMVGYLDLSRLALSVPLIFISTSISQVFFQQTTDKKNNSLSIKKNILSILYLLLSIIVVEILMILTFGPELFGFIFGDKYEVSGVFSQILVFSFGLHFISTTFSSVFITFEKIRLNSAWQIIHFLSICSLFFFKDLNIEDFLKIYVCIEVCMQLIYGIMIWYIINNYEKKLDPKISA